MPPARQGCPVHPIGDWTDDLLLLGQGHSMALRALIRPLHSPAGQRRHRSSGDAPSEAQDGAPAPLQEPKAHGSGPGVVVLRPRSPRGGEDLQVEVLCVH